MRVLPRNEAKERILALVRERTDRSRYVIPSPPVRESREELLRELGLRESPRR